ncbi:unnamed protein product [Paramecium octaurelia]|uniref:Uncharacterized protein n=1 Tax=Paramecium octaurelia TaxID=43137 RepID=A0A8S1VIB4_PAROT|nr:unnamed protein product [Paramecium octaurelia]
MKTESDNEIETLQTMWKNIKQRMESKHDDSDILQQPPQQITINSPYAAKNYQVQIQALQDELFQKNTKLITAQQQLNQISDENSQLQDELEQVKVENSLMKQKLELIESQIDSIQADKDSLKLIRLENEQLRMDVKKLLELLRNTKEYNNIGFDESQSYVKGSVKFDTRKSKLNETNWVPTKCIELMQDYDNKEEVLLQLSSQFQNCYQDKINRLKQSSQQEIEQLKRQLDSRTTVDGVLQQKQIERLKKQKNASGKDKVDISQLQDCFNLIKQKEQQILELQQKIQEMSQQMNADENYSSMKKQVFIEGAQWILAKIMDEAVAYEISLNELNYDVAIKIESLMSSEDIVQQQIINKVYYWITDTSRELIDTFKDKLQSIMNTTNSRIQQL